ncbi:5-keto-D-gluconate-5-reductase [Bosea sp. LC85]|uniref:2-dehydro-3-deoxy-D-gluconate 5-dehydrogenase KduD n=1 Tax=Bosea sp. LC85 TaxID=1502851 RepID=UPI0004E4698C|nr:2-dehydro-3-deoxy-D-gluconate 5-dehydrogenase KduD [Bosea sp. LC85]KFC72171.1 5-keto-D-gluconate-5-reductase [Bosea sp. LC85]
MTARAPFDLVGRTALVTGANTGIGQGIALALAEAGATVVAAGRSSMAETVAMITNAGGRCLPLAVDLQKSGIAAEIVARANEAAGPLDILVNNAGIIRRADALDFSESDWDEVMNVNLKASFFLSQSFVKAALAGGRTGRIVNIASLLSFQGGIRVASYTASKSGLAGLTRLLACEWAGKGINVNAIAPGYVESNNTQALREDADRNAAILSRIPAGRWGKPSDIGGAAVFLASDAAAYVHGAIIPVDGGWLAR